MVYSLFWDYGKYGIFLILGSAGLISSTASCRVFVLEYHCKNISLSNGAASEDGDQEQAEKKR